MRILVPPVNTCIMWSTAMKMTTEYQNESDEEHGEGMILSASPFLKNQIASILRTPNNSFNMNFIDIQAQIGGNELLYLQ